MINGSFKLIKMFKVEDLTLKEQGLNFIVAPDQLVLAQSFSIPLVSASQAFFPFKEWGVPGPGNVLGQSGALSQTFQSLISRPVFPINFAIDRFHSSMTVADYLGISGQLRSLASKEGSFSCPEDGEELLPPFELEPCLQVQGLGTDYEVLLVSVQLTESELSRSEFSRKVKLPAGEVEGVFRRLNPADSNLQVEIEQSVREAMSQWGGGVSLRGLEASELETGVLKVQEPLASFRYSWQCPECGRVYPNPEKAGAELSLAGERLEQLLLEKPEVVIEKISSLLEKDDSSSLLKQLQELGELELSLGLRLDLMDRHSLLAVSLLKLSNLSMSAGVCLLEFLPVDLNPEQLATIARLWDRVTANNNTLLVGLTWQEFENLSVRTTFPGANVIELGEPSAADSSARFVRPGKPKEISLEELYEFLEDDEVSGLVGVSEEVWNSSAFSVEELQRFGEVQVVGSNLTPAPTVAERTMFQVHLALLFERTPEARRKGYKATDFIEGRDGTGQVARGAIKFSEVATRPFNSLNKELGDEFYCQLFFKLLNELSLGSLLSGAEFTSLTYPVRTRLDLASIPLRGSGNGGHFISLMSDPDTEALSVLLKQLKEAKLDCRIVLPFRDSMERSCQYKVV